MPASPFGSPSHQNTAIPTAVHSHQGESTAAADFLLQKEESKYNVTGDAIPVITPALTNYTIPHASVGPSNTQVNTSAGTSTLLFPTAACTTSPLQSAPDLPANLRETEARATQPTTPYCRCQRNSPFSNSTPAFYR